ncbi:MAG: hypothetical protein K6B41_07860 [Butyrivibrio sp.]|nr:hypothetical protein [Butyrivibrio sp.]
MGFFDRFRKENKVKTEQRMSRELEDWNDIVYARGNLDMEDPVQRREYVENCLQQMAEASRELDGLQFEYRTVTSYLRDMEEIDALPIEQRAEINACAAKIRENQIQQEEYMRRTSRMTDEEFEKMERLQKEARSGAEKLKEAESYQKKVKNDLRRLDSEHEAYLYRQEEIEHSIDLTGKLMITVAVCLMVALVALFVVGKVLELDVIYGYMAAIFFAALLVVYIFFKNEEAKKDLKRVKNDIVRLIQLQNKVKIRYVNNKNLMDYLCLKYGVTSARELDKLYDKFLKEREERAKHADAQRKLDENQKDLIYMLGHYQIQDPDIWIHQVEALLDHKEEVEIRHNLNGRRQSLRQRIEYNRDVVAGNAKSEIEDLVRMYPAYAQEIIDMVDRYEEMYPGI